MVFAEEIAVLKSGFLDRHMLWGGRAQEPRVAPHFAGSIVVHSTAPWTGHS